MTQAELFDTVDIDANKTDDPLVRANVELAINFLLEIGCESVLPLVS